ncbi:thioredoxin family protein [Thermomicrobium roseum]|uniref:thioredoxin family protein n=1 Tax=Thermomicrobium roseum TaxID=500 RepID=UPI0002DE9A3F|nr:thioredoxin family protein [Thermomicrobium roseum]
MPILSPADQEYLRQVFVERLRDPITIQLFTQRVTQISIPGYECATCRETNQLLEEVAALSEKIMLEMYDFLQEGAKAREAGVEEIPAIILKGHNKGTLRFIGVPAGYEFATLIEDIIDVSRETTELSPLSRETLAKLAQPVHIKVFVTPT